MPEDDPPIELPNSVAAATAPIVYLLAQVVSVVLRTHEPGLPTFRVFRVADSPWC
jgi:hypothetical protein